MVLAREKMASVGSVISEKNLNTHMHTHIHIWEPSALNRKYMFLYSCIAPDEKYRGLTGDSNSMCTFAN